jgi:hypothetical protein
MCAGFIQDREAGVIHIDPLGKIGMRTAVNSLGVIPKFYQRNGMSMRDYALTMQGRSPSSMPQGSAAVNSVFGPTSQDFSISFDKPRADKPNRVIELMDDSEEIDSEWCGASHVCLYTDTINNFASFRYSKASPTTTCHIMDIQMTCLFDSGSEICIIPETYFKQMQHLVGWRRANWEMVSADDGCTTLKSVIAAAPVTIHGICIQVPIFVSPLASSYLLLGHPFEVKSWLVTRNMECGGCEVTIRNENGADEVTFLASS